MRFPNVLVYIHHGRKRHSNGQVVGFRVGRNQAANNDVALQCVDRKRLLSLSTMSGGTPFLASFFKRFITSIVKGNSASF